MYTHVCTCYTYIYIYIYVYVLDRMSRAMMPEASSHPGPPLPGALLARSMLAAGIDRW